MTESEMIDKMLADFAAGRSMGSFNGDSVASYRTGSKKMLAYQLVYPDGRTLTQKGHEVLEAGGFDQWKAGVEKREAEAHQAALDSAKATVDAAQSSRQSKNAAWFSGIFGAIAVCLTLYQMWKGSETDKELSMVKKRVASMNSLMKAQQQSQATDKQNDHRLPSNSSAQQSAQRSGSAVAGGSAPK